MRFALLLALLAMQPPAVDDGAIPMVNRPVNFSGAAGAYRIEVSADPIDVGVEEPITLTVKIVSLQNGPWQHPPRRDKMRLLPADLDTDFFIEAVPEQDRFLSGENAWAFVWRLMPRSERVKSIPLLEFVYYHTAGTPGFKAADGARSIALQVRPRPGLPITAPGAAGEKFESIATGGGLLTRGLSASARFGVMAAGATLPPVLCIAGYLLWRQLFPDAARRLRRRRGRGLKVALKQLHKLGASPTSAQIREVVAEYLSLHLPLPPGGPTAPDVKTALLRRGLSADTVSLAESFVRRCDAVLFSPAAANAPPDLKTGATQLLQHLEAALCASSLR